MCEHFPVLLIVLEKIKRGKKEERNKECLFSQVERVSGSIKKKEKKTIDEEMRLGREYWL